jgi:hypothetical protein
MIEIKIVKKKLQFVEYVNSLGPWFNKSNSKRQYAADLKDSGAASSHAE